MRKNLEFNYRPEIPPSTAKNAMSENGSEGGSRWTL